MRRVHPSEGCPAMKTYTTKSNAARAARNAGLPASAVTPGEDGTFTLAAPVAVDGVDGPPADAQRDHAPVSSALLTEADAALAGVATPFPTPAAPPPMLVSLAVPADAAPAFALVLAKRSGLPVEVTDCVTGAVQTFLPPGKPPRVPKAEKAARTPRTLRASGELALSGKNLTLLHLAMRPDGLNDAEGCAALGWKGVLGTLSTILKAATTAGIPVRRWKGADGKGRYALGPAP